MFGTTASPFGAATPQQSKEDLSLPYCIYLQPYQVPRLVVVPRVVARCLVVVTLTMQQQQPHPHRCLSSVIILFCPSCLNRHQQLSLGATPSNSGSSSIFGSAVPGGSSSSGSSMFGAAGATFSMPTTTSSQQQSSGRSSPPSHCPALIIHNRIISTKPLRS